MVTDKKWIQKAVNPAHKGFCSPMTKKTCTPKRKALAETFKKMGRARKAKWDFGDISNGYGVIVIAMDADLHKMTSTPHIL